MRWWCGSVSDAERVRRASRGAADRSAGAGQGWAVTTRLAIWVQAEPLWLQMR